MMVFDGDIHRKVGSTIRIDSKIDRVEIKNSTDPRYPTFEVEPRTGELSQHAISWQRTFPKDLIHLEGSTSGCWSRAATSMKLGRTLNLDKISNWTSTPLITCHWLDLKYYCLANTSLLRKRKYAQEINLSKVAMFSLPECLRKGV